MYVKQGVNQYLFAKELLKLQLDPLVHKYKLLIKLNKKLYIAKLYITK